MKLEDTLLKLKDALSAGAVAFIWLVLGMVFLDKFPRPLAFIRRALMPWLEITSTSALGSFEERLGFMQHLLDASERVSSVALAVLVSSFVVLSMYLTFVYQQRKRRMRENQLLLIKNQEIARRNEFIRYISATIGHEFKNNLGRIKRRLDLLPDVPAELRRNLDINMGKLFADIDIFKKISDEREARLIDFRPVSLRRMLQSLASHHADMAEITVAPGPGPQNIFASPTLLRTVFENLIDNSVKYKKPEQGRARVTVSFSEDKDGRRRYVAISFLDEGQGMDEVQADRCFYKVKSTEEGWGQGLSFVKYVVGLHAGKVRVGKEHTAPGTGTEVIINLPLVEEELNV